MLRLKICFCAWFILLFYGFNLAAQEIDSKDTRIDYNLSGPVSRTSYQAFDVELVGDTFEVLGQTGGKAWYTELTFNREGNRLKESRCNMYGEECLKQHNEYDSLQNMVRQIRIERDGHIWKKATYVYRNIGLISEALIYSRESDSLKLTEVRKISYDKNGRRISEDVYNPEGQLEYSFTYRYDTDNPQWNSKQEIAPDGSIEKTDNRYFDERNRTIRIEQSGRGILMRKQLLEYVNDTLVNTVTYALGENGLAIRDIKNHQVSLNSISIFSVTNTTSGLDTAEYRWLILDTNSTPIFEQVCYGEVLAHESKFITDSAGRPLETVRHDYASGDAMTNKYTYYENGLLKEMQRSYGQSNRLVRRRYYDLYGNWTHLIEHNTFDGTRYTHLHLRNIEYYDQSSK
jgi:hypothetical protein